MNIGSVYYNDTYFGHNTERVMSPAQVEGKDLLVFWGGGDINPAFYGERNTHSQMPSHHRDSIEEEVMEEALQQGIPILGVCRGAQLACAKLGGRLYQHVDNHVGTHGMAISEPYRRFAGDRANIATSSLHHQMMIPTRDMEIIATARGHSKKRMTQDDIEVGVHNDPEVIVHRDNKVLMVQGHPEYLPHESALTQFTIGLLRHFFNIAI